MHDALPVTAAVAETTLRPAVPADAAELCVLQRCCWVSEAIVNDTLAIPALHESVDDVGGWLDSHQVWVLHHQRRLVGAVRAHRNGTLWEIGRLMVAPDLEGRGLGRRLLAHAERQAPSDIRAFVLFTGAHSHRNQRMYIAAGYRTAEAPADQLRRHIVGAVYLHKPARPAADTSRSGP